MGEARGADAFLAGAVGHEEHGVFGHRQACLALEGRFDTLGEACRRREVELPGRRSGVVCSAHWVSSFDACG